MFSWRSLIFVSFFVLATVIYYCSWQTFDDSPFARQADVLSKEFEFAFLKLKPGEKYTIKLQPVPADEICILNPYQSREMIIKSLADRNSIATALADRSDLNDGVKLVWLKKDNVICEKFLKRNYAISFDFMLRKCVNGAEITIIKPYEVGQWHNTFTFLEVPRI